MKNLPEALDALLPYDFQTTRIDNLKCAGEDCEETMSYDNGSEPLEVNDLVHKACIHNGWEPEKILCPCCAEKEANADAEHYYHENLFQSQREEGAA